MELLGGRRELLVDPIMEGGWGAGGGGADRTAHSTTAGGQMHLRLVL